MLDIAMDVRAGTHNEDPEWKDGRGAVLMYVLAVDAAARELRREWVLEKVDADDAERGCWRNSLVIEATRAAEEREGAEGEDGGLAGAQSSGAVEMGEDKHRVSGARFPSLTGSAVDHPRPRLKLQLRLLLLPRKHRPLLPPLTTTAAMEEAIPSISTAGVGSRFVSQDDIEAAKSRRDEQWRAAYARHVPHCANYRLIAATVVSSDAIAG